ncbi:MAG: LysR family transcriptional regulator [Rhodospirillales bacterium]
MRSLDEIEAFTAVVERGGFTQAARHLGVGKSAISKQVARLEDRLGARLLNRTTRKISTTEVGRAFYDRCSRIIADLGDAERAVRDLQAEPRGLLRVNAPMSFGVMYLAEAVAAFMSDHPELSIDLDLSDRLVDVVEEGYDLAVRITRLPDSTMIARKLAPFDRVICASPSYWRRHGRPQSPDDLIHHNCLQYSYLSTQNEWTFDNGDQHHAVHVNGNLSANNGEALRAAAIAGHGVLNTPLFIVAGALRNGQLESVLDEYGSTGAAIYAVYPHNRHLSAKIRLFVDFLADRFGESSPWRVDM